MYLEYKNISRKTGKFFILLTYSEKILTNYKKYFDKFLGVCENNGKIMNCL